MFFKPGSIVLLMLVAQLLMPIYAQMVPADVNPMHMPLPDEEPDQDHDHLMENVEDVAAIETTTDAVYKTNPSGNAKEVKNESHKHPAAPANRDESLISSMHCLNDSDCDIYFNENVLVKCEEKHCVCRDKLRNDQQMKCVEQNQVFRNMIGSKCPCKIANAICIKPNDVCDCMDGFKRTADKRNCVEESVKLDQSCVDDAQCVANDIFSHCSDGVCMCKKSFIVHDNKCRGHIKSDSSCKTDGECGRNSKCLNDKCLCNDDAVPQDEQNCVEKSKYHEVCYNNEQCEMEMGVGAECQNKICDCGPLYYNVTSPNNDLDNGNFTKCKKYVRYADACRTDDDCMDSELDTGAQNMKCVELECECTDDYKMKRDDKTNTMLCSNTNASSALRISSINILLLAFVLFTRY